MLNLIKRIFRFVYPHSIFWGKSVRWIRLSRLTSLVYSVKDRHLFVFHIKANT